VSMTRIAAVVVRPVMQLVAAACGRTATVWAGRPRQKLWSPWRAEERQNPGGSGRRVSATADQGLGIAVHTRKPGLYTHHSAMVWMKYRCNAPRTAP
jgi:hypothetical protein